MGITVIMSKTENSIQKVDELTKLSYICRHYVLSSPTYFNLKTHIKYELPSSHQYYFTSNQEFLFDVEKSAFLLI